MKLSQLQIENFLGVRDLKLDLSAPVQLIVGPNGAGKSSTRDAIALTLTADLCRVSLKKEAGQLVRDGADAAFCSVVTGDGDTYAVTISNSGKINDKAAGKDVDPALPYVLEAQRFARLSDEERRKFLFGLMSVKTDAAAIKERLAKRGAAPAHIERVAPMLRAGFDAASKDAKSKASEARGAWKAVTGEAYGSEKAKTWRATVPAVDGEELQLQLDAQRRGDEAIGQAQTAIGKADAELERRQALQTSIPELEAHVARLVRLRAKLSTDQTEHKRLSAELEAVRAAAGGVPREGLVHDMARALQFLFGVYGGDLYEHADVLERYEAEHGPITRADAGADPEAARRLPELTQALKLLDSALANDQRDIDAAIQAQGKLAQAKEQLAQQPFNQAELDELRANLAALQAKRQERQAEIDKLQALQLAAQQAEQKTKQAQQHHADAEAWELIADALAPAGIPGELLAAALGPLNARLNQAALDTDWPKVEIGADMLVRADGRDYRLLSESEKWRCDAMLAEAIANLSGLQLMVLDRFDVLDLKGRAELLGWLDVLADMGEIHTALVFGTLKALPAGLSATTRAHWIQDGAANQLKEAA